MATLRRLLLLLVLSALLASVHGWIVGTGGSTIAADPYARSLGDVAGMEGVIWVDARDPLAYEAARVPEALHLNEENWDAALGELLMHWEPSNTILVYCDGEACGTSRTVARRLREELGVDTVYWLEGGWDSLKERYR